MWPIETRDCFLVTIFLQIPNRLSSPTCKTFLNIYICICQNSAKVGTWKFDWSQANTITSGTSPDRRGSTHPKSALQHPVYPDAPNRSSTRQQPVSCILEAIQLPLKQDHFLS